MTPESHAKAKEYAQTVSTKRTWMVQPKVENLARCYLDLLERCGELERALELAIDVLEDGLIDFKKWGFEKDKDIELFLRAALAKYKTSKMGNEGI